ncbi:MAG: MarR family winged helix-turn-helix transcriptional regulator [Flavobacteriaceae bacterium]
MPNSSFEPNIQNNRIESKIVVALERISEAFRVLLWNESKSYNLSPIQTQLLIYLLFHDKSTCKVGYLAQEFNMTKATISDAVNTLLHKQLINKNKDHNDSRSFTICLTEKGQATASHIAAFSKPIEEPLHQLDESQKNILFESLLEMIEKLNQQGVISLQRNCFSCRFYEQKHAGNYCNLLQKELSKADIRIDCPEHELA